MSQNPFEPISMADAKDIRSLMLRLTENLHIVCMERPVNHQKMQEILRQLNEWAAILSQHSLEKAE